MEIEIEISKETLMKIYKIFIILFFFGFSLWIFYLNYQTVQNYPIVFGDEGYHMRIAKEMFNRKEFLHYLDYYKPNPPAYGYLSMFHFLEAFGFLISELFTRLLLPLTVFLIAFSMFVIFWKLFDEKVALISAILFQTFQSTVIYSVTFFVDSLFVLFIFLAFAFAFLYSLKERNNEYIYLSSAFASLSLLTKSTLAIAIIPFSFALLFYILILEKKLKQILLSLIFPIVVFSSIVLSNVLTYDKICVDFWFISQFLNRFLNGSCEIKTFEYKDQYSFAARGEQIGSEVDVFSFGLLNYLDFAYGYSTFILILSVFSILYIILNRKFELVFPLIPLIILSIYSITFDYFNRNVLGIFYRAEDTARYLYFFNPFLAFYISYFFVFLKDFLLSFKLRNQEKINLFFTILFFISLIFISFYFYNSYLSKLDVMQKVKTFSLYFFDACNWVKNNLDKNATLMSLWSHRVVYACERNVGGSNDLRLSNNATFIYELAKKLGVNYFFIEKFSIDPLNRHYAEMYDLSWLELIYSHPQYFEKVYENGIPFEECKNRLLQGIPCDGIIIFKIK